MRILLTAGPTREAIDPVRYLSNRSSGKMGYAIARAATQAGHDVVLISGPVCLAPPEKVEFVPVISADEMYEAVESEINKVDAAVFCAAVADYRPCMIESEKIKKSEDRLVIEMEKTRDILGSARSIMGFDGILVGFAAETRELEKYAREKMERKGCDLLVANDVSRSDIGFGSDQNEVKIFSRDSEDPLSLPTQSKDDIAKSLISLIEKQ